MEIKIEIPKYNPNLGVSYSWDFDFSIEIKHENGISILKANKAGLISLANHLLNLAQDEVPEGCHLHLDDINSLDEGSQELVIEKISNIKY